MGSDKKNMDLTKTLAHKLRSRIWIELVKQPEQNVTDIAKNLGIAQSSVTDQIKILETAKLVKTKYQPRNQGVAKICYPSYRGVYEQIAKLKHKNITEREYENIDDFYFKGKFRELLLEEIAKQYGNIDQVDALIVGSVLIGNVLSGLFMDLAKKDPETLKQWKTIEPIHKKLS